MKKGLKIFLIVIVALVVIFASLIGIQVYKDMQVEKVLNKEVQDIQNIMDATEFDEAAFKDKLNHTVSTGDYYKVERAYKNYLRDYLKSINDIDGYFEEYSFTDLLSTDNIKNDGKNFINTKLLLNNARLELEKITDNFNSMKTEEKVLSYLDNTLDDYYKDYYKKIVGEVKQNDDEKELSLELEKASKVIQNVYAIFEFLSQNKNNWYYEKNTFYFSTDELLDEYNSLVKNISNTSNNTNNL